LRERVLTIVSLIAQYILEKQDLVSSDHEIVEQLLEYGFEAEEIDAAFSWMEHQGQPDDPSAHPQMTFAAPRVFSGREKCALSLEARGFLVRLRSLGILDVETEEEIIQSVLDLDEEEISLKEIRHLAAMLITSRSRHDLRREIDCILQDDWSAFYH
jgi:Smg protein